MARMTYSGFTLVPLDTADGGYLVFVKGAGFVATIKHFPDARPRERWGVRSYDAPLLVPYTPCRTLRAAAHTGYTGRVLPAVPHLPASLVAARKRYMDAQRAALDVRGNPNADARSALLVHALLHAERAYNAERDAFTATANTGG